MKEDFMLILSEKHLTSLIKKTNEYTVQFGLCLTDSDIHALVLSRRECLSEQQRIEFDEIESLKGWIKKVEMTPVHFSDLNQLLVLLDGICNQGKGSGKVR